MLPQGEGQGVASIQVGAWALPGLKTLRSGNPEAEEEDMVATSPSPFKTPKAGRLPWPHRLPSRAPSWEEGAACATATG